MTELFQQAEFALSEIELSILSGIFITSNFNKMQLEMKCQMTLQISI